MVDRPNREERGAIVQCIPFFVFCFIFEAANCNGSGHFEKHKQLLEYQIYFYLETSGANAVKLFKGLSNDFSL